MYGFSWLCVPLIQLSVLPTDELRDRLSHVQRTAESLCTQLEAEQRFWKSCLAFLHLPLFGFLGYKATGAVSQDLVKALQWWNLFMTLYSLIGLVWFLARHRYLPMPRMMIYLLASGILSYRDTNRNIRVVGRIINFLLVFEITFVLYIASIWETFDDAVLKYAISFVLFRRDLSDPIPLGMKRRVPTIANILVAISVSTTYIAMYDSEGTAKADWTEWLG